MIPVSAQPALLHLFCRLTATKNARSFERVVEIGDCCSPLAVPAN
jgi:hypothetical protein